MAMAIYVPLYTVDDLEHFPDDGNRYERWSNLLKERDPISEHS
jgi:hypothetical protein